MSITLTVESTVETAWIAVLKSTDLVAALGSTAQVRRDYDLSASDVKPAITVQCVGVQPMRERMDGYWWADVAVTVVTSMDVDTTGATRATLAGGVRDVFAASALLTSLATASGAGLSWIGVEQPDITTVYDYPDAHERELAFVFRCTVKMPA